MQVLNNASQATLGEKLFAKFIESFTLVSNCCLKMLKTNTSNLNIVPFKVELDRNRKSQSTHGLDQSGNLFIVHMQSTR